MAPSISATLRYLVCKSGVELTRSPAKHSAQILPPASQYNYLFSIIGFRDCPTVVGLIVTVGMVFVSGVAVLSTFFIDCISSDDFTSENN